MCDVGKAELGTRVPPAHSILFTVAHGTPDGVLCPPPAPHFSFVPLLPVRASPLGFGGKLAACWVGRGVLPPGAGLGRGGGRMELPLGGQFRSCVWDEAVGKRDFTQPPLQVEVRESALRALEQHRVEG